MAGRGRRARDPLSPLARGAARAPVVLIRLVVTEHASYLTPARARGYEAVARRLERVAGEEVRVEHYRDDGRLEGVVVLSGSLAPWAAHDRDELERLGERVGSATAVLGICAGMQLLAEFGGGRVEPSAEPERGFLPVDVHDDADLLSGVGARATVYQEHMDEIAELPERFRVLASSPACRVQALAVPERRWWGTQFHPERGGTRHPAGDRILRNFFTLARA